MDRREFLKRGGAVAAGGVLAQLGWFEQAANAASTRGRRPNIVVILVDEMRFPTVFPHGVHSPGEFLRRYMPNLYELWRHGVKFERYYSAGNACSPARATLATGLYPHQEWLLATRTAAGPALQPAFPTYGKLLTALGYETPYVGKWHLSNPPPDDSVDGYLANYGFIGLTNPDPIGTNGQGADNDANIAAQAVQWLQRNSKAESPYCLTVSFVNPHDKQFFWAGSEADRYYPTFDGASYKPYIAGYSPVPSEENPSPVGYPALPGNWESYADLVKHGKPDSQQVFRSFQELVWGGAPDLTGTTFASRPSPCAPRQLGVGIGPSDYWQRGLDMYTLVQTMVDEQIGRVIASVPRKQLGDTVFVFASDHGEYAGAHGILSGKIGTAYEEAIRVPLIVTDPSHRFTKQVQTPRRQLASSVDLAPMLVTLGNRGSTSWMRGRYAKIYGERLNLVELLSNPSAPGRDHVLFATDEILPNALNYLHAPTHLLAVRTRDVKLVTYSHWARGTTTPIRATMKLEFYDYATASGRAETESTPDDPRVKPLLTKLLDRYAPTQMEAPLPGSLRATSKRARASYMVFSAATNAYTYQQLIGQGKLKTVLGYGEAF